ncbi:alkaline phosphatase-like protein [Rhizoclosmatium globosum]|uniref:Alkaline phosphatase-like protein n=1 Tax=Rhizoclosmatium globosum TaxID=329046 RepID=A0A1Y2D3P1_9FUNG|nr:alkaline phosphatase-like protein [Rhizoclosmatium globosum]|eukprot:ORY53870.1 alkaline phosphatase-like protein [Rhizoclosmatium globosum]
MGPIPLLWRKTKEERLDSSLSFTQALTSFPSDSFPGLAAQITGGSPATHGFYYDVSYSRSLYDPSDVNCTSPGVPIAYDESVDVDKTQLSGGCDSGVYTNGCGIDPTALPRNLVNGKCVPWYAHQELRVNTIFEVAKAAGYFTAWTDKHPIYEFVNGPSGSGTVDLYTPEQESNNKNTTETIKYDTTHVNAIVNWINGNDHFGKKQAGSYKGFLVGGNLQVVSIGQKLNTDDPKTTGGYLDAKFTPNATLAGQIAAADAFVGQIIDALKATNQWANTLFIVSAKHGQSSTDHSKWANIQIDDTIAYAAQVAGIKVDDVTYTNNDNMLIWVKNGVQAPALLKAISANLTAFHADGAGAYVKYGKDIFGVDPAKDSKQAEEHGGNADDDRHVALIVGGGVVAAGKVDSSSNVITQQIAPTILQALGLDPNSLQAVAAEKVAVLPGVFPAPVVSATTASTSAPTGSSLYSSARSVAISFAALAVNCCRMCNSTRIRHSKKEENRHVFHIVGITNSPIRFVNIRKQLPHPSRNRLGQDTSEPTQRQFFQSVSPHQSSDRALTAFGDCLIVSRYR